MYSGTAEKYDGPHAPGTTISNCDDNSKSFHAVAAKDGITVIRIHSARMLMAYGFLRKVFEIFEQYRTPIDMITTSEVAVSIDGRQRQTP